LDEKKVKTGLDLGKDGPYSRDMDTTQPTETLTDREIAFLRSEAESAGDTVQVHTCDVALGTEAPVTTAEAFEERYGGGGFADWERAAVLKVASAEQARSLCADAVADARAREDAIILGECD
jgi:hypothetical protein